MTAVEVVHVASGERRTLAYAGETHTLVMLHWPQADNLSFRRTTGDGIKRARGWRITGEGRATLGLSPAPKAPSPRARKKVTLRPVPLERQVETFK